MRNFFYFLFLFFTTQSFCYQCDIGIIAIFRDEADYLEEWIEYHQSIGVDHFILYNHLSQDHYKKVLSPYIKQGVVELHQWSDPKYPKAQVDCYRDGITRLKGICKWLALIDVDEFIVLKNQTNLKDFLKNYENFAGLIINWQLFGTSNIQEIPKGKWITKRLLYKFPEDYDQDYLFNISNKYVKSIIQPLYINEFSTNVQCGAHVFDPIPEKTLVDADFHSQKPQCYVDNILTDKIVLNHYWTRDLHWFFNNKMKRRLDVGDQFSDEKLNAILSDGNLVFDDTICKVPIIANHVD